MIGILAAIMLIFCSRLKGEVSRSITSGEQRIPSAYQAQISVSMMDPVHRSAGHENSRVSGLTRWVNTVGSDMKKCQADYATSCSSNHL